MRVFLLLSLTIFALLAGLNPSNARRLSENEESIRRLDGTDPPTVPADGGMTEGTQNPTPDSTAEGTAAGTDAGTQQDNGDPTPAPIDDTSATPAPGDGGVDTPTPVPVPIDDPTFDTPAPTPTEEIGGGGDDISQPPTEAGGDDFGGGGGDDFTDAPTAADDNGGGGFDQPTFAPISSVVTEPPQFATPAPALPEWPTDAPQTPTDAPVVPYNAPEDDILNPEEEDEISDEWKWGEGESIEEMEHDKNVLIALSVVGAVGLCFALISAQQIIENPDGCCASICRMWVACLCGITRCVCWPCRYVCGCTGRDRRNHDLIMAGDSNYTHDLELS